MRLWHILPAFLPNNLLLNQHRTTHLLLKAIADGKALGGMARYQNHAGFVVWVHSTCVDEMRLRGMRHDSPALPDWRRVPTMRQQVSIYIPNSRTYRDIFDLNAKQREGRAWDARLPLSQCSDQLARALAVVPRIGMGMLLS